MHHNSSLGVVGLALLGRIVAAAAVNCPLSFPELCRQFTPEAKLPNATRTVLEYVTAGSTVTFPGNDESCGRSSQEAPVNLCRVALEIPTSARSAITMEMWFPEPAQWTGRFLATGNGGIDGCIKYEDIAYGAANGFASVGTNNGHNGTAGDAFYKNEDVVEDFAWRSLHTSAQVGKQLATSFYGTAAKKSYYIGCSLGGRQGIHSAKLFPDDFDGIVAGSPAVDFNALYSSRARYYTITGAEGSEDFVTADTWQTTIHDEVLRQCDGLDGVMDGIIEDPTLCQFQADELLCREGKTSGCLTSRQVGRVQTVFEDYLWPNGSVLYPGMQPGSEQMAATGLYVGAPYGPSVGWFKFAVLDEPNWDPASYSISDALAAAEKDPGGIRTWPSSLAGFEKRGGKLLTYHGLQDQQITSHNSNRFYEHLRDGMGYSYADMDGFYRFFRVPGMDHCRSGPGAWVLGQGGNTAAQGIAFDGANNVLAAVVDWVEAGIAPEAMVGTKFVNDSVGGGVDYQHRHCKYPAKSTFKGEGYEPSDLDSWACL